MRAVTTRTALFEAFRDSTLALDLWAAGTTQPGTRVRPHIEHVGVTAPAICV